MIARIVSALRNHWFLIGACLLLCTAYFQYFVDRARVDLSITVEKRCYFRLYWAGSDEPFTEQRSVRLLVSPEQRDYRFYFTDLGNVQRIRVDPHDYEGTSTIHRLAFAQPGWTTRRLFGDNGFSALQPLTQIERSAATPDGLLTVSSGNDPTYLYQPQLLPAQWDRTHEAVRLLVMFLLLYGGGLLVGTLGADLDFVPLCLAAMVALILTMAIISSPDVHPDEGVHRKAAAYYQTHWFPPAADDAEVRDTYGPYGNSRLNGREIYYVFAGKFADLLNHFHLPDHLPFRLFNVTMLLALLLLSLPISGMRWMAATLLISPQLWYVFSYCNSDAFALLISIVCCALVADRSSRFNRYLLSGEGSHWFWGPVAGSLVALLLLVKSNYLPVAGFLVVLVALTIWQNRGDLSRRSLMLRLLLPGVIGVICAAGYVSLQWYVNDFALNEKKDALRAELALPLFNPTTPLEKQHPYLSMKERGVTAAKLIHSHRWLEKSFRSGFGVYGHMTVSARQGVYDLFRWLALVLLGAVCVFVLLKGDWPQRGALVAALVVSAALVGASFYHSWTADFQAQGRYLFPLPVMIGAAVLFAKQAMSRRVVSCLLLALFSLSGYSFLVVGLPGMAPIP
ncbi:MAG: hypothetical protein RBS34_01885 [Desulfofustis sp.]|jgi:hypothetical protein|nr:hypothetical protein [Desulfofustis sp.]